MSTDAITLKDRIEKEYLASGNHLGWRLLASPASVLEGAEVAFLGLNPGGSSRPVDHPEFCTIEGSAYVTEIWDSKNRPGESRLQLQVRELFKLLCVNPEEVLAGNLVPFRSSNWETLKDKSQSLAFGKDIWRDIFRNAKPRLVICMGSATFHAISQILESNEPQKVSVGWGSIAGSQAHFAGGLLVGLPHLSRFGIIKRSESQIGLQKLFGDRWKPQT